MIIPENGRVVVIDDDATEYTPLIRALSKKGVPLSLYTERREDLPRKPLSGIRIVFLDIVLGTDGQPLNTQISTVKNIFNAIVDESTKNGPYILVAWTKHNDSTYINAIKQALSDSKRMPTHFIDLEKNQCKDNNGEFDINKIEDKIKKALQKTKSFRLFTLWENFLHNAGSKTVNEFSSFYDLDSDWDNNISIIFSHLAKAYSGTKSMSTGSKQITKSALLAFNNAFMDTLENQIKGNLIASINFKTTPITPIVQAKINNKLLLLFDKNIKYAQPGNIYGLSNKIGKKPDLNELFQDNKLDTYPEKNDLISNIKYIFLEVSPSCDYAQEKLRIHRCLAGVLWPFDHAKKIKKYADFLYKTPSLEMNNKLYVIVFDLRYFFSMPIQKLRNKKALFRLRRDLLIDIQSGISKHINRPGILSLSDIK